MGHTGAIKLGENNFRQFMTFLDNVHTFWCVDTHRNTQSYIFLN